MIAYELATGSIHVFHAKAVVIAGGPGRNKTTSNTALNRRRHHRVPQGTSLGGTWVCQFTLYWPVLGILISEAVRGEGGRLLSSRGR